MPKYTVYLDDALDRDIRCIAQAHGSSLTETIRRRIQSHSAETKLQVLEDKVDAVFAILELVIGDIGYMAGATRAGTKNVESALKEGGFYETQFRRAVSTLKRVFERSETTERGV